MANYKVTLGTGLAWTHSTTVEALNEQDALDIVADNLEETGLCGLYYEYDELAQLADRGQTADEYAEANGLVCCGNHGIYVQLLGIEEVMEIFEKCKEILNYWIDGEDADEMIAQIRSLRSVEEITEEEYNYIVSNWDKLLIDKTE